MSAVIVRRRLGSRRAKFDYHAARWWLRNRTNLMVTAVFLIACIVGLAATSLGFKGLHLRANAAFAAEYVDH